MDYFMKLFNNSKPKIEEFDEFEFDEEFDSELEFKKLDEELIKKTDFEELIENTNFEELIKKTDFEDKLIKIEEELNKKLEFEKELIKKLKDEEELNEKIIKKSNELIYNNSINNKKEQIYHLESIYENLINPKEIIFNKYNSNFVDVMYNNIDKSDRNNVIELIEEANIYDQMTNLTNNFEDISNKKIENSKKKLLKTINILYNLQ
jgi:hypothetical protein